LEIPEAKELFSFLPTLKPGIKYECLGLWNDCAGAQVVNNLKMQVSESFYDIICSKDRQKKNVHTINRNLLWPQDRVID
jgi:hypothetical protein